MILVSPFFRTRCLFVCLSVCLFVCLLIVSTEMQQWRSRRRGTEAVKCVPLPNFLGGGAGGHVA